MENLLSDLDLDTLKTLHESEAAELNARLINGASWQEVADQRKKVTELSILIHNKTRALEPARFQDGSPKEKKLQD